MSVASEFSAMKPGDHYLDAHGRPWRVVGYCTQPVVIMERLQSQERITAGINGRLWDGFRKLPEGATPPHDPPEAESPARQGDAL